MEGFNEYVDEEFGYTIKYPNDWGVGERQLDLAVILRAPLDDIEYKFHSNINISVQDLSQNPEISNLENFTVFSIAQIDLMIDNFSVKEKAKPCKVDGNPGYEITYTGTDGPFKLKFKQKWTIKDKTAYVLTYTSTEQQYDAHRKTAQLVLESFRFI